MLCEATYIIFYAGILLIQLYQSFTPTEHLHSSAISRVKYVYGHSDRCHKKARGSKTQ